MLIEAMQIEAKYEFVFSFIVGLILMALINRMISSREINDENGIHIDFYLCGIFLYRNSRKHEFNELSTYVTDRLLSKEQIEELRSKGVNYVYDPDQKYFLKNED